MRDAARVEVLLLLLGEVAFLGFGWLLGVFGGCARALHTPGPSQEGRFEYYFLFDN